MDVVAIFDYLLRNSFQAKFVATQLGLPDSFVDKAIDIVVAERSGSADPQTAASMSLLKIVNEYKAEREREFQAAPNELMVQCKCCRYINKVIAH